MRRYLGMLAVGGLAAVATPAGAAITFQPGEWQDTTTGMEDGKPVPPEIDKSCMTPAEARDAANIVRKMKEEMQSGGAGQCQKFDVQESGNTVTFVMKCGDARMMAIDMSGTFTFVSATRYQGSFKSAITIGGKTMTQDKKVDAVRIGECKK